HRPGDCDPAGRERPAVGRETEGSAEIATRPRGREVGLMRRCAILLVIAVLPAGAGGEGRLSAATGPRLTAITATAGVRPAVLIEASEPVADIPARPHPFTGIR